MLELIAYVPAVLAVFALVVLARAYSTRVREREDGERFA